MNNLFNAHASADSANQQQNKDKNTASTTSAEDSPRSVREIVGSITASIWRRVIGSEPETENQSDSDPRPQELTHPYPQPIISHPLQSHFQSEYKSL